ncbi:hypothetical protein ACWEN6_24260 [Sphaerisporangium sp. NPDC004334]
MGIGQMVVPGTPRDSLYILDTLINIDAGPQPKVVTTDHLLLRPGQGPAAAWRNPGPPQHRRG